MTSNVIALAPVPFDQLPKRKREFVKEFVKTGDAVKAYVAVGYKDGPNKRNKATDLKRELHRYIGDEVTRYASSSDMAILGLSVLKELAETSTNDAVRLNSAKALLERAIHEAPKEVTVNHKHSNVTEEEVDSRLEKALQALGYGNVIDITPEKAEIT